MFHPIGIERRIGVEISHDHTVVQLIVLYVFCQHLRFFQSELPVVRAEMGDDDIQSIRFYVQHAVPEIFYLFLYDRDRFVGSYADRVSFFFHDGIILMPVFGG